MKKGPLKRRVGELRPSQLIFTFGIGSIVELPYLSVMVMGIDEWETAHQQSLGEPRLLAAVQKFLGPQVEKLAGPPLAPEEGTFVPDALGESARIGIPVSPFPRWVYCPFCNLLGPVDMGVFQLKANPYRPDKTQFVHQNCQKAKKPPAVLPARFLVSCKNGHIQDFPWREFLHQGKECQGALRLHEWGVSGLPSEVILKCDGCGDSRNMAEAFNRELSKGLGMCSGQRPHLRDQCEGCDAPLEPVLAGASNVWFPLRLSLLSIPEKADPIAQLVEEHWTDLKEVGSAREVALVCKFLPKLKHIDPQAIWLAITEREESKPQDSEEDPELKRPEWEVFSDPGSTPVTENLELKEVPTPESYGSFFERVVLVPRLREVHAFLAFTRLESAGDFGGIQEVPEDRRVPISRGKPKFVPSAEVRGEGLFLQFREDKLQAWLSRPGVISRAQELFAAHEAWRRIRRIPHPERNFPGMRYVLLHTFAHALMRQFSLECGYTAASLRERIYSAEPEEDQSPMAGILIYTATPDSEGTLGGLVELGRPETLARHLDQALEVMRLCTSDPLCAEQLPVISGLTLHGAACHACLFAPETSCERGNKYLDRNALVPTMATEFVSFFGRQTEQEPAVAVKPEPKPAPGPDTTGAIPILKFGEGDEKQIGGCSPEDFGLESVPKNCFAVHAPCGLEYLVPPGTLCLFKRLGESDDLPKAGSLVIVDDPKLEDPDWGQKTLRRLFYQEFADTDNQLIHTKVILRPRSTNPSMYQTQYLTVAPDQWPNWRPLATYLGRRSLEDT